MPKIKKDDLPEEVVDYIEELESHTDLVEAENTELASKCAELVTKNAELTAKVTTATIEKGGDDLDELIKSADPAIAAVLIKQRDDNKALADRISKADDDALNATLISKAAKLPMIGKAGDIAPILKAAAGVTYPVAKADGTTEQMSLADAIEGVLGKANAAISEGNLFKSFGTGGASPTISASVEGLAAELRKTDPTLTAEQAIAKAYEVNPALYDAELAEKG